ncbi:MAG: hypothetical protein ACK4RK_03540 [Gemmataceae bacterium]
MKHRLILTTITILTILDLLAHFAFAQAPIPSKGLAAIEEAENAKKYLFVFFWKADDPATRAARAVFDQALAGQKQRAVTVAISVADPAEKDIVEFFGISRAPMPLVLAVAPNGAVTKALHTKLDSQELLDAFVSEGTAHCLRVIQENKLLLLCVQNSSSSQAKEALQGVQAFQADPRFAKAAEIVVINPADPKESKLLHDFHVDPKSAAAVTVFMAPNGVIIGKFEGAVTKDQLEAKLKAAQSGQCPCGDPNCPGCNKGK